jgi:hypothetical protein
LGRDPCTRRDAGGPNLRFVQAAVFFAAPVRRLEPFTTLLLRLATRLASLNWASRVCCCTFGSTTARSSGGIHMTIVVLNRRNLLAAGGAVLATGVSGMLLPARAAGLAPTESMSGGANNYRKGAAVVERIGKGGFWMSGTVRRAGDGTPLSGQRIQIWAHTTEGQEHEPHSHGATLTDKNGAFRLEMPQIIPIFGQPHGHLAYDSSEFKTVFLRPVMRSAKETSLEAHFVLQSV